MSDLGCGERHGLPGDPPRIIAGQAQEQQELFLQRAAGSDLEQAKMRRNASWQGNALIPGWVNREKVELDRFFTRPEVAKECHADLLSVMREDGAEMGDYRFVEPSAGSGAFYELMPKGRRIGIDIVPAANGILCQDFLSWSPGNGDKYVVLGNPPFGYRAWLALSFINHSATFADYIGMILPMAFQSDGKGSPKHRVAGASLVKSELLPSDSFVDPDGKKFKVNSLWQVWRKGESSVESQTSCDEWIDLFTVDMRKERLCGQSRLKEADWFIQRTFFGKPPRLVKSFDKVRYVCGYGLVFKKSHRQLTQLLMTVDWRNYSNLAAHNCRHISMYHIRQAVMDGGFTDA